MGWVGGAAVAASHARSAVRADRHGQQRNRSSLAEDHDPRLGVAIPIDADRADARHADRPHAGRHARDAARRASRPRRSPVLAAVEAARKSPRFEKAEPEARLGIERLRLWDRKVDGRPVAALYEAFVRALWRRTFADEMDADVFQEFFGYGAAERYAGIDQIIDNPTSHWWNDIATVDKVETRDDIVLLAAADAVISLRAKFGDEGNWAWDRVHALSFRHALGAGGALLNWAFSRGPSRRPATPGRCARRRWTSGSPTASATSRPTGR